jgi:tagatose 6-phosphate kinase
MMLPGGKGINVARTAHALGGVVLATGLVAGSCGQWICALLEQAGISHSLFHLPRGESRISTILVDPERGLTTVLHDADPIVQVGMWPEIRRHINQAVQEYPWVALCGSCPPGLPGSVYADLCQDLQTRGQRVCLDTRGVWLTDALRAQPYLVKCNQSEAAQALNCTIETPVQARNAARQWIARGIECVVITLGAQGAIAAERTSAWYVAAPQVKALSPVGSGDTVMAGLIAALQRGEALPAATRYGVALGTANALTLGSACYDPETVPELHRRTEIIPMDSVPHPDSGQAMRSD